MRAVVVRPWWVLAFRGSLAALFAFLTVASPVGLGGMVALFGAYALMEGATNLVMARARFHAGLRWPWLTFEGGLGAAVGLAALFGASMNGGTATALIAVWALGRGVAALLEVVIFWWREKQKQPELPLPLPDGLASLAFGLLLLAAPGEGSLAGTMWIGAFAMVSGLVQVARAASVPLAGRSEQTLPIIVPTASAIARAVPIRWRTRLRWQAPR